MIHRFFPEFKILELCKISIRQYYTYISMYVLLNYFLTTRLLEYCLKLTV